MDESLGNWCIGVLDKVNEGRLGDVLTVKLTNLDLAGVVLLGPVGSLIINRIISIIIWETLIEDVLEGLTSGESVGDVGGGGLWGSSNHDGKSNVVVVRDILLLISGSSEDGGEGVVSNDLSEGLEGDGLNGIWAIGWEDLQSNGLDLINWHGSGLRLSIKWVGLGNNEVGLGWGSGMGNWSSLNGLVLVVLVVLL